MAGTCFSANLLGKCPPKKLPGHKNDIYLKNDIFQKHDPPEAMPPTKGTFIRVPETEISLKRVAVGATGLLNNEPDAKFRGFDITKNIKTIFMSKI